MNRLIFHVDLDAFFASVEELEDPGLKGKPVIVGGRPDKRGVVATANYAARAFGVRSAMTTAQALRRCPQAILKPPQMLLYRQYSERVMAVLNRVTAVIEQVSIDEAFLDLTDYLPDDSTPLELARHLQNQIQTELGLSVSIGIAANKLMAKMAGNAQKPRGLTQVAAGAEADFLALLPVESLWGVGPKTAAQLAELGIKQIGDVARLPEATLVQKFGVSGAKLWRHARGIDNEPVRPSRAIKSLSLETTFARDTGEERVLQEHLMAMSRKLAQRLHRHNLFARTVTVKLRYGDFSTFTRSITAEPATNSTQDLYRRAGRLLQLHWNADRPLRLIGLEVSHFVEGVQQLALFEE